MKRIYHFIVHWPKLTLVLTLLLTGLLGNYARQFRIDSSVEHLLATNDPNKKYYEEVRALFPINRSRGVAVHPGRYEFNEYFVFWNTNSAAQLSVNSRYSTGEFYDGYRRSYTLGPAIRVNGNLNASVTVQVNDVTLSTGDFVSTLVTGRVNYNITTRMFVNALLQFNTDSRQWSSNLRFNVIHRPLSDFFLSGRVPGRGQPCCRRRMGGNDRYAYVWSAPDTQPGCCPLARR